MISEQELEDLMENDVNEADQIRLDDGRVVCPPICNPKTIPFVDPGSQGYDCDTFPPRCKFEPIEAPAPSSLAEMERIHILATMEWATGNKARAARQLGITIKTLYTRLHEYGYAKIRHVERRSNGAP